MAKRGNRSTNGSSLKLDVQAANDKTQDKTVWTTQRHPSDIPQTRVSFQSNNSHHENQTEMNGYLDENTPGDMSPRTPPVVEPVLPFTEKYFSWRYVMVFLMQSSLVVFIFLRSCMSMALVCMTELPGAEALNVLSSRKARPVGLNTSATGITTSLSWHETGNNNSGDQGMDGNVTWTPVSNMEFSWSPQVQGLILTAALILSPIGPLIPNIIKTFFNVKNKHVMSASNLLAAVVTLLSPMGARISPYVLVALRMVLGLVGGVSIPIIGDLIAWWAPQGEKLSMSAISFVGISVGSILTSLVAGFLCSIPVDNGWPFIFYFFGILTLLWGMAWHFLCTEKPEEHPYISDSEKEYILTYRADMTSDGDTSEKGRGPPWKQIMTSVPVIAAFNAVCCHYWATNVILMYLPTYLATILGFSVQQIGLLASIIALTRIVGTFLWTTLGNLLAPKMSTRLTRKVCITSGFALSALTMVGVAFCGRNERWLAYGFLLICMIAQACGTSHLTATPQDMAPRYAGLITGLFFSIGSLVAITGPLVISNITTNGTQQEWMVVWIIKAGVFLLGALGFCFLGNSSLQPWARVNRKSVQAIPSSLVDMGKRISVVMDRSPVVVTLTPPPDVNDKLNFSIDVKAPIPHDNSINNCGGDKVNEFISHVDNGGDNKSHHKPVGGVEGLDNEAFSKEDCGSSECNNNKSESTLLHSISNKISEITKL